MSMELSHRLTPKFTQPGPSLKGLKEASADRSKTWQTASDHLWWWSHALPVKVPKRNNNLNHGKLPELSAESRTVNKPSRKEKLQGEKAKLWSGLLKRGIKPSIITKNDWGLQDQCTDSADVFLAGHAVRWGLVGGSRSLGLCLWQVFLPAWLLPYLSAPWMLCGEQLSSAMPDHYAVLPLEPANHRLNALNHEPN